MHQTARRRGRAAGVGSVGDGGMAAIGGGDGLGCTTVPAETGDTPGITGGRNPSWGAGRGGCAVTGADAPAVETVAP